MSLRAWFWIGLRASAAWAFFMVVAIVVIKRFMNRPDLIDFALYLLIGSVFSGFVCGIGEFFTHPKLRKIQDCQYRLHRRDCSNPRCNGRCLD